MTYGGNKTKRQHATERNEREKRRIDIRVQEALSAQLLRPLHRVKASKRIINKRIKPTAAAATHSRLRGNPWRIANERTLARLARHHRDHRRDIIREAARACYADVFFLGERVVIERG